MGIKRGKTVEYIISFMETYGYAAMFIAMVLENANIPIPSEIVLGFAGYLIAQGVFDMHTTMVVGTLAGIVGSVLSYWMGEYGGRPLLLKYGKYVFFNEHKFELAEKMFNKYGGAAVFFGRLLPGVRTFISFPAGWRVIQCGTSSFGLFSVRFLGQSFLFTSVKFLVKIGKILSNTIMNS